MKVKFTRDHFFPGAFKYMKDQVVDSTVRSEAQMARWIKRGIVVAVPEETPVTVDVAKTLRTATNKKATKHAVRRSEFVTETTKDPWSLKL